MPEYQQGSGQCDSVTGNALDTTTSQEESGHANRTHATNTTSRSTAASALAIAQHQSGRRRRSSAHTQRHESSLRSSSTRLVPVSATSRGMDTSSQLPPSPPSTPSHSPRSSTDLSTFPEQELRHALASINAPDELYKEDPSGGQSHDLHQHTPHHHHQHSLDTPDSTPLTISPVDGLGIRHQPGMVLGDFVKRIAPNIVTLGVEGKEHGRRGRYIIEDASMELVCQGWTGAVLVDTKPSYISIGSVGYSPGATRLRSTTSSARMSRASSASSVAGIERPSPRRTLLTQMAHVQAVGENLRCRILDVLDHATEKLHTNHVIFVLDRSKVDDECFRTVVHGLCYVGATVIGHGPHADDERYSTSNVPLGTALIPGGDVDESIHAPRCVGQDLVLLGVDV